MNILDKILAMYNSFSATEKNVADYIIKNKQDVPNMTIAELAKNSQVSEASVTRFCKKIEVSGFHSLKINLAQISFPKEIEAIEEASLSQQLEHIKENKLAEITQTMNFINVEPLEKVLEKFQQAKKIIFLAYGNTIPVALDAAYRFNQIGIFSIASEIWDTNLSMLLNLTNEDLVVVISNSGETKELIKAVTWCQENQIHVISITNNNQSPIALLSNQHLLTATRERLFQKDYYFSRISAMLMIETIFLLLSFNNPERLEKIHDHESMIADNKI